MNKEKLKQIIKDLIEVSRSIEVKYSDFYSQKGLKIDDAFILEQGIKIYLSETINESKKENIKEMKEKPQEPATAKQIEFLKSLGMKETPKGLTKLEASHIIDLNYSRKKETKK